MVCFMGVVQLGCGLWVSGFRECGLIGLWPVGQWVRGCGSVGCGLWIGGGGL